VGVQLDETEIKKMNRISIRNVTCKKYGDLATWFSSPAINDSVKSYMTEEDKKAGPTGAGYVFTLQGVHYHDEKEKPAIGQGANYVRHTLLGNLQSAFVKQGDRVNAVPTDTPVRVIGISHATIATSSNNKDVLFYPNGKPNAGGGRQGASPFGGGGPGAFNPAGGNPVGAGGLGGGRPVIGDEDKGPGQPIQIRQTTFTIQFVWKPTPVGKARDDIAAVAAAAAPPAVPAVNVPVNTANPVVSPSTSVATPPTGAQPTVPPPAPGG